MATNSAGTLCPWVASQMNTRLLSGPYRPLTSGGQGVGQRNLAISANTYTHVLTDARELDYANLLAWARLCSRGADPGADLGG